MVVRINALKHKYENLFKRGTNIRFPFKWLPSEEVLERNELATRLAERIVLAHATRAEFWPDKPETWAIRGLPVLNFADSPNTNKQCRSESRRRHHGI